jgi:uncharacterized protein
MAKFLLLVGVIAAVVLLVKNFQRSLARQNEEDPDKAVAPTKSEDMVRCERCGVHLPRSESFLSQGRYFCTDEHRRLGASGPDA